MVNIEYVKALEDSRQVLMDLLVAITDEVVVDGKKIKTVDFVFNLDSKLPMRQVS